jgi:hypothetical protein
LTEICVSVGEITGKLVGAFDGDDGDDGFDVMSAGERVGLRDGSTDDTIIGVLVLHVGLAVVVE